MVSPFIGVYNLGEEAEIFEIFAQKLSKKKIFHSFSQKIQKFYFKMSEFCSFSS